MHGACTCFPPVSRTRPERSRKLCVDTFRKPLRYLVNHAHARYQRLLPGKQVIEQAVALACRRPWRRCDDESSGCDLLSGTASTAAMHRTAGTVHGAQGERESLNRTGSRFFALRRSMSDRDNVTQAQTSRRLLCTLARDLNYRCRSRTHRIPPSGSGHRPDPVPVFSCDCRFCSYISASASTSMSPISAWRAASNHTAPTL